MIPRQAKLSESYKYILVFALQLWKKAQAKCSHTERLFDGVAIQAKTQDVLKLSAKLRRRLWCL